MLNQKDELGATKIMLEEKKLENLQLSHSIEDLESRITHA